LLLEIWCDKVKPVPDRHQYHHIGHRKHTLKKCCEKRCEMTGKKGENWGNEEELRGFYFLYNFNKLSAISTHCETPPDLITNQLLHAATLNVILIVL
jgi:hypothetical protein